MRQDRAEGRVGGRAREALARQARSINWRFVGDGVGRAGLPMLFILTCWRLLAHYAAQPQLIWSDAHVYFQATESWIAGGNPWLSAFEGIPFAAPPPALLLNLPLLPFGETVAVAVWAIAGTAAVLLLLRRFRLPFWWMFFYPIAEGWSGMSPDLTLAALVYVGGGAVAALTKPYSIPALLSEERWGTVVIGLGLAVVTIPLLPWALFIDSRAVILLAFADFAHPNSAWGAPLLTALASVALVMLGRARGLALLTPAILGQQPHYAVFSLGTISRSRILAAFITLPLFGSAAVGVILYALHARWSTRKGAT